MSYTVLSQGQSRSVYSTRREEHAVIAIEIFEIHDKDVPKYELLTIVN